MDLLRLAVIRFQGKADQWTSVSSKADGVEVMPAGSGTRNGKTYVVAVAVVPLESMPALTDDGYVTVPEGPRETGERAIEEYVSHVSLMSGREIEIVSPNLPIAFRGSSAELDALRRSKGIVNGDLFLAGSHLSYELTPELVSELTDRVDGVDLLAEALATGALVGQFQALIKLYERGFASSSTKLVLRLSEFLQPWNGLGYSKTEVKKWISRMRGSSVHADRNRPFLREADYREVLPRMLFAGYDLLLNKEVWNDPDLSRRGSWSPTYGPLVDGGILAVVGKKGALGMQMLDRFAAFRTNTEVPKFELGEDCWPRTAPDHMSSQPQQLKVVKAKDFRRQ